LRELSIIRLIEFSDPDRKEETSKCKKLHNEELCNLYTSLCIVLEIKSRRMRCAGHLASMGAVRNIYKILAGKPERRTPFGISRHGWKSFNKIYQKKMGMRL
jgi:hypothetical protein